jgi:hypothetical protein
MSESRDDSGKPTRESFAYAPPLGPASAINSCLREGCSPARQAVRQARAGCWPRAALKDVEKVATT